MSRTRGPRKVRDRAASRVLVNTKFASSRRKLALRLTVAGFVVLSIGLLLGSRGPEWIVAGYGALVVGSIISWAGIAFLDRWVALPRSEEALATALGTTAKDAAEALAPGDGHGSRMRISRLATYSWLLPADHVVAAPWGLAVLDINTHDGPVRIEGAKWRDKRPIFRRMFSIGRRPVRNPDRWLKHEIDGLRKAMIEVEPTLVDVPIVPASVFARERTVIEVTDADPAVLRTDELEAWLRGSDLPALPPAQRKQLLEVLDGLAAKRIAPKS